MLKNNAAIDYLMQRGIEYQLLKRSDDGSQQATVREYGINPALIAQAQLMQDEHGVMLVVIPHDRRLDSAKLQQLLQRNLQSADELLTRQLFHCDDISAIAPLPLTTGLRAVIDNSLRQHHLVCFEANDNNLLVCISVQAFMRLHHNAEWADISQQEYTEKVTKTTSQQAKTSGVGNLQQRLLSLRELPPVNDLTRALLDIFKDPGASVEKLASVIETDAPLSAQVLRHARSPYYAYGGEIESVADAITKVLGFDTVLMTSLAIASGKTLQIPREGRIGKQALCRHSLYSAVLARSLCRHLPKKFSISPGTAYLTALMQNVGFLLLGHLLRPDYDLLCRAIEENAGVSLLQLEDKTLGINHAQIGTWLMRSWNMPEELVVALRQHHNLVYCGEHAVYVQLIALVNTLLKQYDIGDAHSEQPLKMLLKALEVPEQQALEELENLMSQDDELKQLASSLSG